MGSSTGEHRLTVARYMTPSPHVVTPDANVLQAQALMRRTGTRHLPVVEGERLVGIVSDRDIASFMDTRVDLDPTQLRIDAVMKTDVFRVNVDTALDEVAYTMASHKYGSAVVWDGTCVAGIFTTVDALHALATVARPPVRDG